MKSSLKHSLHLCLIVSALMLTACGKKENKVNSSGVAGSSPFYTGNSSLNSTAGATIINQVNSLKTNVACSNGYRLTNDANFFVNGGYLQGSGSKIGGNWQPGFLSTGTINKMWVGVSAFRDLMFVTQVTNGSQVIGFNVTISFCEMKSIPSTLPSIISNERTLRNFQAPLGIVLDADAYCGYNVIDAAPNTIIVSERNLNNPTSPGDATIPTSFTKPTCNGQL